MQRVYSNDGSSPQTYMTRNYALGIFVAIFFIIVVYFIYKKGTSSTILTPNNSSTINVPTPGSNSTITATSGPTTTTISTPTPNPTTTVTVPTPASTTTVSVNTTLGTTAPSTTIMTNVPPSYIPNITPAPSRTDAVPSFTGSQPINRVLSADPAYGTAPTSGSTLFQSLVPPPYSSGYNLNEAKSYCSGMGGQLASYNTLMGFYNKGYDSGGTWGWTTNGVMLVDREHSSAARYPGANTLSKYGVFCSGQPSSAYKGLISVLP